MLLRNYAASCCWAITDDNALAAVVLKAAPDTRQRLAFRLLGINAAEPEGELFTLALDILRNLAQQTGSLRLPAYENLPRGTEHAITDALLPLIRGFEQRERVGLLLTLVEALGKRGWHIEALQDLLEKAIDAKPDYLAKRAIELWLAPAKSRDARVRRLLDKDPSVIVLDRVRLHLHLRRQDWLDPFLTGQPIKGRFLTGKTVYILPILSGFHRWLPRQQRTFADWLRLVADDQQQDTLTRVRVIRTLALIPTIGAADLSDYLDDAETVITEAALAALAWIDRPSTGLPILLQHVDRDRARVAMYAVPRCARLVEPEVLVAALQQILSRDTLRATVHKEAIRLLGTVATPASLPLPQQQAQRPAIHRDVRIAIGHAARNLLGHEAARGILEGLVQTGELAIVRSLCGQQPTALGPTARVRYAKLLVRLTTHTDVRARREAYIALKAWTVGAEADIAAASTRSIVDLENAPEWETALEALLTCCRDGLATEYLQKTVRTLMDIPVTDSVDATSEQDLPARQRLFRLCRGLCDLPASNRLLLAPTLEALASICLRDATLWPQAALLRVGGLAWATPEPCLRCLIPLAQQADPQPVFVQALREAVQEGLQHCENPLETTTALELVDGLVDDPSPTSALLALEALRYAGSRSHWVEACAQRLRILRHHPNVGVRAVACRTWTA